MEHPAHRIADMAADVAEELRGYLAPAGRERGRKTAAPVAQGAGA